MTLGQVVVDATGDEPRIARAAILWAAAERERVGVAQNASYVEEQRAGFVETMRRPDAWIWVAIDGDEVVGAVGGFRSEEPGAAYLAYLVVDERLRRRGLAQALVLAATRSIRAAGEDRLLLTVHESNVAARRMYEAAGWRSTERTERTPIDDELLVEYRFDL